MPKVLRIINRFNLGGPTYNAAYLTKYLAPEFETLLAGGVKDKTEDTSEFIVKNLGIDYVLIPEMRREINFFNDWKAYHKILKIIKQFKPDIVHTHASKAGTLGRLAAHRLKVPVIVHTFHGHIFHSYFGKTKTSVYKVIERKLARYSDKIVAISEKQKLELSGEFRICPKDKIAVIRLGFDLSRFSENKEKKRQMFRHYFNLDENEIAIGIVGRLVPVKNHQLFIKAIAELKNKTPKKIRAFVVGDGSEKSKMEVLARNIGLNTMSLDYEKAIISNISGKPDIVFTSWIRKVDIVYAGLDITALTSFNEGTPVSLIESLASGIPVVSTKVGGIENIIIPGQTGLLSDLSLAGFSRCLCQLIEDESLRKCFGYAGKLDVDNKYNYQRLVDETGDLYRKLLAL